MNPHYHLRKLLLEAGLSETDATLYIELCKKPAQTIFEFVQRTRMSKSSVYRSFENLKDLKICEKTPEGIKALSLKNLVCRLYKQERKFGKLANKIKQIAPFLHLPLEESEEFETFYDTDHIRDAYLTMSKLDYSTNFDFGDFENFITAIGDLALAHQFRLNRVKHANHHAICTTFGPNTAYFASKKAAANFKNRIDRLNINFNNRFIIFSDTNNYVFFGDVTDPEYPTAVIVKSKSIADIERLQFANFSQMAGN